MNHRPKILNIHFHAEESNCYSSKDYTYNDILLSVINIKCHLSHLEQLFRVKINISHYSSDSEVFIIHGYVEHTRSSLLDQLKLHYPLQAYSRELVKEYWSRYEKKEEERKQKEGYVNYSNHYPKPLNELRGNLIMPIVIANLDYLGSGIVWGYFGDSSRKLWMDNVINDLYTNGTVEMQKKICSFLNHSQARHWMDNAPDTEEEFKQSFIKIIENFEE